MFRFFYCVCIAIIMILPACSQDKEGEFGFERLGEPRPGEWRFHFKEKAQSLDNYKKTARNLKTDKREAIYIQPLGKMDEEIIKKMSDYASIFFDSEVKILKTKELPEDAYNKDRNQYDADDVIDELADDVPDDALCLAGITNVDLYSKGLNFVFGSGSLVNRCGVYSLHRLQAEDKTLFLRRSVNLMCHELGHILGITHCVTYHCLMNGSNSLEEADKRPMYLCPIDLAKLEHNLKFDRLKRYEKLYKFYKDNGLKIEGEWTKKQIDHIRK